MSYFTVESYIKGPMYRRLAAGFMILGTSRRETMTAGEIEYRGIERKPHPETDGRGLLNWLDFNFPYRFGENIEKYKRQNYAIRKGDN